MKVLFLPEVSQQFVELVDVLYDKGYMSFLDQALDYSESLFREIQHKALLRERQEMIL